MKEWKEGRKDGKKEGRKEGRKESVRWRRRKKEGHNGRKEGRILWKEGCEEGRKEGKNLSGGGEASLLPSIMSFLPSFLP